MNTTPIRTRFSTRALTLSLGLILAACGSTSEDPGGGPDAGAPGPDADEGTGAPTVMASPSNGEKGVLVDAPIVLTFSAPMNTASVEAAWSSESLPKAMMGFSWNNAGTILTVDASSVLIYAEGGINVDTYGFEIKLDATAQDAEGRELDAPFLSGFDTARDITMELGRVDAGTGAFDGSAVGSDIRIGDNASNGTWIGFITIDLSQLPTVVELTSASLFARQTDVVGLPYTDLGNVGLDLLTPAATIDAAAYGASAVMSLGVFSNSAAQANPGGNRTADVLAAIKKDFDDGNSVSRFRLAFDDAQDLGNDVDHVIFDRTSVRLDIRFLAE